MTPRAVWVTAEAELPALLDREADVTLFAFGSPERPPARPDVGEFHAFLFNDIAKPSSGLRPPNEADVARLLAAFGETSAGCVVFQCWMGVSRSTAAALLFLVATGRWTAEDAAWRLREAMPWASPNIAVVAHGDGLLGLDGILTRGVRRLGRGEDFEGPRATKLWSAS